MIRVFISSTTADLGSYREEVKRRLLARENIEPVEQRSFDLDYRKIATILNSSISECDAVICLVGFAYGHEPRLASLDERRQSYSQMEYDIAKRKHKPTFVFLATDQCPLDNPPEEDSERLELQRNFRRFIMDAPEMFYPFSSKEELAARISLIKFKPLEPIQAAPRRQSWTQVTFKTLLLGALACLLYLGYSRFLAQRPISFANQSSPPKEEQLPAAQLGDGDRAELSPLSVRRTGNLMVDVVTTFQPRFVDLALHRLDQEFQILEKLPMTLPGQKGFVTFTNLPLGDYELTATLDDQQTMVTSRVTVSPDQTRRKSLSIRPVLVRFKVSPADADIQIENGRFSGAPPRRKGAEMEILLRPGQRTLTVSRDRYDLLRTTVFVTGSDSGKPLEFTFQLHPRMQPLRGTDWEVSSVGMKMLWLREFWMSETEVTRGQFAQFVDKAGYALGGVKCLTKNGWEWTTNSWKDLPFSQTDQHPVVGVNWEDAQRFCRWLTETERQAGSLTSNESYHLPSVAQYESVLHGYRWSMNHGNFAGTEVAAGDWPWPLAYSTLAKHQDGLIRTGPAAASGDVHPLNSLCDLAGNVAEWCSDSFTKNLNRPEVRQEDPDYFDSVDEPEAKAIFGASWSDHDPFDLDLRVLHKSQPRERTDRIGFRVVLSRTSNAP